MLKHYSGAIKLQEFKANVICRDNRADVGCHYKLHNPTRKREPLSISIKKSGINNLSFRRANRPRPSSVFLPPRSPLTFKEKIVNRNLNSYETKYLDLNYSIDINGNKTKLLKVIPEFKINNDYYVGSSQNSQISIELPVTAKNIVSSKPTISLIENKNNKIYCHYHSSDAPLLPIFLKWTEINTKIVMKKRANMNRNNICEVTITMKNEENTKINNLTLWEDFPASEVEIFGRQANLTVENLKEKPPRIKHQVQLSLKPKEQKTYKYEVKVVGTMLKIPDSYLYFNKDLISVAEINKTFKTAPPVLPEKQVFTIPSGFNFDFLSGDHHLNQVGIWSYGQNYNLASDRLSWNTKALYTDKNHDDDYIWSVNHQIIRFNPAFLHMNSTPWLGKTGNTTYHNGYFQNDELKRYPKATILLRGWRFDFTSGDHHINKIRLNISNINFNKNKGEIKWKTSVIYADKNFDDNYRYLYYYAILGFNGEILYEDYSGSDKGGSGAHNGDIKDNILKNYNNAIVVPMGWSFDFKSKDHHINVFNFNIRSVRYTPNNGSVSWYAGFNYADKNFDDDYYWKYKVAIIVTNQGEARDQHEGPYVDNGGYDVKSYNTDINGIFVPITWQDGICNGDETGVDCGGSSPAKNMNCIQTVNPGHGPSSDKFSLEDQDDRAIVQSYANTALVEYAYENNKNFHSFYSGVTRPDRYIEAVGEFIEKYMEYVSDGLFGGAQSAKETLTESGHRGPGVFNGDCEDFAILITALLRSLGFSKLCIFCADHHNSVDQGQKEECYYNSGEDPNKSTGGHTFNIVIYKGKYRILDQGKMKNRYWANKQAWNQHTVTNIWNDHTGKHWSKKDTSPFNSNFPLINYPGNPCNPSSSWDWRTYFCDVTL